jgi:hypothetical protein
LITSGKFVAGRISFVYIAETKFEDDREVQTVLNRVVTVDRQTDRQTDRYKQEIAKIIQLREKCLNCGAGCEKVVG